MDEIDQFVIGRELSAGNVEEGRNLYQLAMKADDPNIRRMAAISWMETEWEFCRADRPAIEGQLSEVQERISDPAAKAIVQRVLKRATAVNQLSKTPAILNIPAKPEANLSLFRRASQLEGPAKLE